MGNNISVPCRALNDDQPSQAQNDITVQSSIAPSSLPPPFVEWAKVQPTSPFGDFPLPWQRWRSEKVLDTPTPNSWIALREAPYAIARFDVGGESIDISLGHNYDWLIELLPCDWQEYYDLHILSHPRRAKLLDRAIGELYYVPWGKRSDHWGSEDQPAWKQRDDLILLLHEIKSHSPITYADFERVLQLAIDDVFFCDPLITLQSGEKLQRKKVVVTQLSARNQQREFSVKQINRLRREIIQRACAKAKADALEQAIPHKERAKARKNVRKQMRRLKNISIESQSGLNPSLDVEVQSGIGQAFKAMMQMPTNFNNACQAVSSTGGAVTEVATKANSASSSLADTLKGIKDMLTDILTRLKQAVPKVVATTIMVGFLYYAYVGIESPLLKAALVSLITPLLGVGVYTCVSDFFKADNTPPRAEPSIQMQSGLFEGVTMLPKLLAMTLIGTVFYNKKPETFEGLSSHVLTTMNSVPRSFKGVEGFMETCTELVEAGVNAVRGWFNRPPIRFANKFASAIGDLATRVHAYSHLEVTGTTGLDPYKRYTKLMGFHHEITTMLQIHGHNKDIRQELGILKSLVLKHAHPLRHETGGAGGGYRVQPASVIIAGRPGIGKTTIVQSIALTVMKLTGEIEPNCDLAQAERAVFTKPANSPYMDGYQDQFCFLIDDLFAIKPTPNLEGNSLADIMALYGGFTTMLNMAECDKKGMFPFCSKLLLMTTNAKTLAGTNISSILLDESAFLRRIDFHVEIRVRPQYRKRNSEELDYAAYAREAGQGEGLDAVPWHIWEYFDTSFAGNVIPDDAVGRPLKELVIRVAERINMNKKYHLGQQNLTRRLCDATITPDWEFSSIRQQSGFDEIEEEVLADEGLSINWNHFPEPAEEPLGETLGGLEVGEPTDSAGESSLNDEMVAYLMKDGAVSSAPIEPPLTMAQRVEGVKRRVSKALREGLCRAIEAGQAFGVLPDEKGSDEVELSRASLLKAGALFVPFALVGLGAVAKVTLSLVLKMFTAIYTWFKEVVFGRSSVVSQSNMPKPRVIRFIDQQSGGDVPMLWKIVYDNTFKAAVDLGDSYGVLGQILFLKNNFAVMPAHFITHLQHQLETGRVNRATNIRLRGCKQEKLDISVTVGAFLSYDRKVIAERDLCFVNFVNALKPRRNIMKMVLRASELKDIGGNAVRLDTARMDRNGVFVEYNDRETFISPSVTVGTTPIRIGNDPYAVTHKNWLRYKAATKLGDCGAVLSLTDHTAHACRLIAGLHVGLDEKWGHAYATPLDFETCEQMANALGVREVPTAIASQCGWDALGIKTEPLNEVPFTDGDTDHFGSFEPYLKVTPGISMPIQSSLVPTALGKQSFFKKEIAAFYGQPPDELEVMKMGKYTTSDGVVKYAMAEAMRPFSGDVRIIDQKKFSVAIGVAMHPFNNASIDVPRRILTFEEAVVGIPALGLKGITRQTSVGFPWIANKAVSDKSYFFGKDQDFDLTTPAALQLKDEVLELQRMVEGGVRPLFVCRDFLKDEVRKKGKTARLIAGTDIRYYILCRMYFGLYVATQMKMHQASGICTGMNQYSEWQWLYEHLSRNGKSRYWDGDFAGFDSSQQPSMLWPILHQINNWYGPNLPENKSREILFEDLTYSKHLTTTYGTATAVVEWQKSLPSGHFLTSTVNSILSMSLIVSAFIATTGSIDFWANASVATQGDDNVCSVSDEYAAVFNQIAVAKHVEAEFGMTYTAGRKGEALREFVPLEDLIFLQRRFAWKNGYCVCPIRPESFLHNLYYTNKGLPHYRDGVVVNSIEDGLQELAMHTEEMWELVAPKLVEALKIYGVAAKAPTETSTAYFELVRQRVPDWQ